MLAAGRLESLQFLLSIDRKCRERGLYFVRQILRLWMIVGALGVTARRASAINGIITKIGLALLAIRSWRECAMATASSAARGLWAVIRL